MSGVVQRYAEDPTGLNPDNLVSGEIHVLSDRPVRAVVPKYGMFFTKSLRLYDHGTMMPLVKGQDYTVPVINQEASLRFAEEIADVILITNTDVSSKVILTYQVLGGPYQNNISNIVEIYETWLNDKRGVDWISGVFGKPAEYPVGLHPHHLEDLFGFESVNFMLERIAQAITMGNTAAFDDLIGSLNRREVAESEIDISEPVSKFMTLRRLMYALDKFNFNTITLTPDRYLTRRDIDLGFEMKATNMPSDPQLYWTIEHITTDNTDFLITSGTVKPLNGVARFSVKGKAATQPIENRKFRIHVRKDSPTGYILVSSYPIELRGRVAQRMRTLFDTMTFPIPSDPSLVSSPVNHYAYQALDLVLRS